MKAIIYFDERQNFPYIAKNEYGDTIQTYGESIACKSLEEARNLAKAEGYEVSRKVVKLK